MKVRSQRGISSQNWIKPKCLSVYEWIKKMKHMILYTHTHTHTHTLEYYSAFKRGNSSKYDNMDEPEGH